MHVSTKFGVLYIVSKFGSLFLYELTTGALLFRQQISAPQDTIFIGSKKYITDGIIVISKSGSVISANLDEKGYINYILSKCSDDIPDVTSLAFKLANRYKFLGSENQEQKKHNSSPPKELISFKLDEEKKNENPEYDSKIKNEILSTERNKQDFLDFLAKKSIPYIQYCTLTFSRTDKIGGGGFGTVYKGRFVKSWVAIKEYKHNIHDRNTDKAVLDYQTVISEIANTTALNFPKFNRCFGASLNSEGILYTVHELAECSLAAKLEEKLSLKEKNEIVEQILEIMSHLYNKKVVHRDLKPENFLISKSKELQICDFGTIRTIKGENENQTLSQFYNPQYAPPEIVNEENIIGLYSDIWSLGIMLYEIYYGEKFWKGFTRREILIKMAKNELPQVKFEDSNVPKEIQKIIKGTIVFEGKKRIDLMKILELFESM